MSRRVLDQSVLLKLLSALSTISWRGWEVSSMTACSLVCILCFPTSSKEASWQPTADSAFLISLFIYLFYWGLCPSTAQKWKMEVVTKDWENNPRILIHGATTGIETCWCNSCRCGLFYQLVNCYFMDHQCWCTATWVRSLPICRKYRSSSMYLVCRSKKQHKQTGQVAVLHFFYTKVSQLIKYSQS